MPLEFLLAVHSATLMPDLAYDMTQKFDTTVNILLHESKHNDLMALYKTDTGYISDEQVATITRSGILDEGALNDDEVREIIALGIIPPGHNPPECGCVGVTQSPVYHYNDQLITPRGVDDEGNTIYRIYIPGSGPDAIYPSQVDESALGEPDPDYSSDVIPEVGDKCNEYIKTVVKFLKKKTVTNFGTYVPYISKVENHWYRDVYFVVNTNDNISFVKNDYDYEALMKERWTEYEVWGEDAPDSSLIGKYKLYKVSFDKDGNYKESEDPETNKDIYLAYESTRNQEDGAKVKYVKRAKTIDMENEYEDLYWFDLGGGVYSAYEPDTGELTSIEPMFTDEDKAGKSEIEQQVMDQIYGSLKINGITQSGDGVRAETNKDIKQMFLLNRYFRYDGTKERAEQITQLREEHEIPYGALNTKIEEDNNIVNLTESELNEILDKSIEYNNGDTKYEVKVRDVSGSVQITQDSLNAFSMLENTHTLDADYIYRDFKELIVELGFFTKEELMESIPKIMQFPVPEIGTGGYPFRRVDKREIEKGTYIHSKGDIDAMKEQEIKALLEELFANGGEGAANKPDVVKPGTNNNVGPGIINPTRETRSPLSQGPIDAFASIDVTDMVGTISLEEATADREPGEDYSDTCTATVDELLENARKMCEEMEQVGYDYCVCDPAKCHHVGHCSSCGLDATYDESKTNHHNVCCATLVAWILRSVGVNMEDCENQDYCPVCVPYYVNQLGGEIIKNYEDLKPGDIMCMVHAGSSNQDELGHVELLGEEDGDAFVLYNGGGYIDSTHSGIQTFDRARWDDQSLIFGVRLFENTKHEAKPYEGYLGNEAVVAPMTGVLLEYGTYSDDDKVVNTLKTPEGKVEQETYEYRENVDLNYPLESTLIKGTIDENNNSTSSQKTTDTVEKEKVVDKVGYAKILVLDSKYMKMLEKATDEWDEDELLVVGDSGVDYKERLNTKEELKEWNDEQKTVYGFKEFAENYYDLGLEGFVIYIDGFVCELPEETDIDREKAKDEDLAKTKYDGEDLTFDIFKEQTLEKLRNGELDERIQTQYEKEDKIQLASKSETDRINTERSCKDAAFPVVTANDFVFIKEGTIIGRTMSDIESNESTGGGVQIRKNPQNEYTYYRPEEKQEPKYVDGEIVYSGNRMIGNYIRTQFYDSNYEVVENVEDYMRLDSLLVTETIGKLEEFMYWQAKEAEGFEYQFPGEPESYALTVSKNDSRYLRPARSDNPSDKYGHDYWVDGIENNDINLCPGMCFLPSLEENVKLFKDITGKDPTVGAGNCSVSVTGEQLLDMYQQMLTSEIKALKETYPALANLEDDDTKLFGLLDVMYAGSGNFELGTIKGKIQSGDLNLTLEDFLSNAVPENTFYSQNPEGLKRRRAMDYYIYAEGKYCVDCYDKADKGSEMDEMYKFISETPFQDMMVDKDGAEKVPFN